MATELHAAAMGGSVKQVKVLLRDERAFDPHVKGAFVLAASDLGFVIIASSLVLIFRHPDANGQTPFEIACCQSRAVRTEMLPLLAKRMDQDVAAALWAKLVSRFICFIIPIKI
jgi:hypothetical protein